LGTTRHFKSMNIKIVQWWVWRKLNPPKDCGCKSQKLKVIIIIYCLVCSFSKLPASSSISSASSISFTCHTISRGTRRLEKIRPILWKIAKTIAKPNNSKIQTMFLYCLFWWKCNKFVAQGVTIFGLFLLFKKSHWACKKVA
jgi:hypothetical protein